MPSDLLRRRTERFGEVRAGGERHREDLLGLHESLEGEPLLFLYIGVAVVGRAELGIPEPEKQRQAVSALKALTASCRHAY